MIKVLVGLPGCGKSTYAKELADFIVFSSDNIREEIYGNAEEQSNPGLVFSILYERMEKAIQEGKNVILDATNIKRRDRKQVLDLAKKYNQPIEAIIFDIPLEICLQRNSQRERKVPYEAYERMIKQYTEPTIEEGFTTISYVKD